MYFSPNADHSVSVIDDSAASEELLQRRRQFDDKIVLRPETIRRAARFPAGRASNASANGPHPI
jgi:hypothetical protein